MNPNEIPGLKWILSLIVLVVFITILYLCHPGRHVIRSETKDRNREREMRNRKKNASKSSKDKDPDDDENDAKTVALDGSFASQRSGCSDEETDSGTTNDSVEASADDMV